MPVLSLVPIYLGDGRSFLDAITPDIEEAFGVEVMVRPPWFDPESAFDPSRGQYSATRLLLRLLESPETPADSAPARVLGIAGVDLFIPVLTYVFGEAQLDGRAAVVSTHRLRTDSYGLPRDDGLAIERLRKEAIHEIAHTFGLTHCRVPECVMTSSTYVEEIDLKSDDFCAGCLPRLRSAVATASLATKTPGNR